MVCELPSEISQAICPLSSCLCESKPPPSPGLDATSSREPCLNPPVDLRPSYEGICLELPLNSFFILSTLNCNYLFLSLDCDLKGATSCNSSLGFGTGNRMSGWRI